MPYSALCLIASAACLSPATPCLFTNTQHQYQRQERSATPRQLLTLGGHKPQGDGGGGDGQESRRVGDSALLDEWWSDDEEDEDGLVAKSQVAKMTIGPPTKAALLLEAARWRCMSSLAARFRELTGEALGKNWSRHFEKWLYSTRSTYEAAGLTLQDPCLPSFPKGTDGRADRIDTELVRKLAATGMHPQKAEGICHDIARQSTKAIQGLSRGTGGGGGGRAGRVTVEEIEMLADEGARRRVKLKLTCCGISLEVNEEHYAKLRRLYERTVMKGHIDDDDDITEELEEAVFRLLARYSSFQGAHYKAGGFQAAIHGECFDILRQQFGCKMECFASPMNCRWPRSELVPNHPHSPPSCQKPRCNVESCSIPSCHEAQRLDLSHRRLVLSHRRLVFSH